MQIRKNARHKQDEMNRMVEKSLEFLTMELQRANEEILKLKHGSIPKRRTGK